MKLIHTADLHLGSKIKAKLKPEQSVQRRRELRESFTHLIARARELGAGAIILAGDVFDTDPATPADRDWFFSAIEGNPDLTFLLLRGNHDATVLPAATCANLFAFGDEWTTWQNDAVAVSGIEITDKNYASFYDAFKPVEGKINIAVLHGDLASSPAPGAIVLSRLADRGIDYLALGHIHAYQTGKLGARGVWAYSGCPEGRGVDEPGEKGFVLLTAENGLVTQTFVPHARRVLHEIDCDLSAAPGLYEAVELARKAVSAIPQKDAVRLNLTGAVGFDRTGLAEQVGDRLNKGSEHFFVSVKDKTKIAHDVAAIRGETSLRGEFARLLEGADLPDEEKDAILELGLRALSGDSLD